MLKEANQTNPTYPYSISLTDFKYQNNMVDWAIDTVAFLA